MRLLFVLKLMLFCNQVLGSTVLWYELSSQDKRVKIPFYQVKGESNSLVIINDICKHHLETCNAWQAYQEPRMVEATQLNLSSIAAAYCKKIAGVPLILKNTDNEGQSFCLFEDNSLISSWDLYFAYEQKLEKDLKQSQKGKAQ